MYLQANRAVMRRTTLSVQAQKTIVVGLAADSGARTVLQHTAKQANFAQADAHVSTHIP